LNILFIANRFPYPPYRGDKLKIFNLAKRLCVNHRLFLLTFIQDKKDIVHLPELRKYFDKIETIYLPKYLSTLKCAVNVLSSKPYQILYFSTKKFKNLVDRFVCENKTDIIHTQHLRMSQYTYDIKNIKRILDLPDAYSLYWERRAKLNRNIFIKLFDRIEYKKVMRYESIINEFDLNLVCSEEDKVFLTKAHKTKNIEILPNGVDLSIFDNMSHDYDDPDDIIIFTGNMDYSPNIDAVVYFVEEVFPLILSKFPKIKFHIVGQKPVKKVLNLQSENVIIKGFIEDIASEYNKSTVAISPVRIGAGTLNKVLEPMAVGVPVVSTKVGFKGLGISSGEGAILADDKFQFANAVIKLLGDKEYRREVGIKGKLKVSQQYSWDTISYLLEKYCLDLCTQHLPI